MYEKDMGKVYIGTSGWHYDHWKGIFYPKDLSPKDYLKTYGRTYKTVEINNTFYPMDARKLGSFRAEMNRAL